MSGQRETDYPASYAMIDGGLVRYDPREVLSPDIASEALGVHAASAVLRLDWANPGIDRELKVLEAGVGSGICIAGLVRCLRREAPLPISISGFDISQAAVRTTQDNIEKLRVLYGQTALGHEITTADWNNKDDMARIALGGPYDVVMFNPPYLSFGTPLFAGYEDCPPETVYSDDADGLDQYRTVLPWLAGQLSDANGAALVVRLPVSSFTEKQQMPTLPHDILQATLASLQVDPRGTYHVDLTTALAPLGHGSRRLQANMVIARGTVGSRASAFNDPDVIIGMQIGQRLQDGMPVVVEDIA